MVTVKINNHAKEINKEIDKEMAKRFTDVVLDLKRMSSQSAPHDTGFLEKNKHTIKATDSALIGEVWFEANKKGFSYAEWTHNEDYNLGEQSKRKPSGKSKYASGSVAVGKGYLANSVSMARDGYIDHISGGFEKAIKSKGRG